MIGSNFVWDSRKRGFRVFTHTALPKFSPNSESLPRFFITFVANFLPDLTELFP